MARKIILFELNEVPWRIVDDYARENPRSTFAQALACSFRYRTFTEDIGHLSPWSTWPTLHRGVTNDQHLIADFGQDLRDVDQQFPPLWTLLTAAGVSTGIGGSLHTYPMPTNLSHYSFYLPDTFAAGSECFPESLESFQAFNLSMARESARNVSRSIPWAPALRVLRRAPELGLRPATFIDVARQLVDERRTPERRVRRRTYQAVLAFDVFMRQLKNCQPAFATFFTNHVASAMHRYWAAAYPTDYGTMTYSAEWREMYRDEIRFAMGYAARQLSRVFRFCDEHPEYTTWVVTSMGQAATTTQPLETQLYVVEPERFMGSLNVSRADWQLRPAMLPQFNVTVDEHHRTEFLRRLADIRIAGAPLRFRNLAGLISIDFGHANLGDDTVVTLAGRAHPIRELGLKNVEIEDKSGANAYHIPEGCLVIYDPQSRTTKPAAVTAVSTVAIAPAIMSNFGVQVPSYMKPAGVRLG